jgi:hypothetical protein
MLRAHLIKRCVMAVFALGLAACGQASAPTAEAPPDLTAPAPGVTDAANPYCAEVSRRVSAEDCDVFGRLADEASAGVAAFNAPNPMRRDEAHTLQLAISLAPPPVVETAPAAEPVEAEANVQEQPAPPPPLTSAQTGPAAPAPQTPSETVEGLPGETVEFAPLVGRFMRAELIGDGFEITERSPASQEVLQGSVTTWTWNVVAKAGGLRTLTLRTVVEGCTAENQCYPLRSTTQNYPVEVQVGWQGQVQDVLRATPDWLKLVTAVLVALAALISAIFGLRNAFRKGRSEA